MEETPHKVNKLRILLLKARSNLGTMRDNESGFSILPLFHFVMQLAQLSMPTLINIGNKSEKIQNLCHTQDFFTMCLFIYLWPRYQHHQTLPAPLDTGLDLILHYLIPSVCIIYFLYIKVLFPLTSAAAQLRKSLQLFFFLATATIFTIRQLNRLQDMLAAVCIKETEYTSSTVIFQHSLLMQVYK